MRRNEAGASGPSDFLAVLVLLMMAGPASAQTLAAEVLVKALRQGGYVIVMRHASSPTEEPNKQTANADNVKLERQLDVLDVRPPISASLAAMSHCEALARPTIGG